MRPLLEHLGGLGRRIWIREDVQFILHCVFLLAMMALVRPMFAAEVPRASYEAPSILWAMLKDDVAMIAAAAQKQRPAVPHLLFLVVPTGLLLLGDRVPRWSQWERGKSLRAFLMVLIGILAWSGSTFDYNMYLDRGHFIDRLVLVALAIASWRTPLAVPFATKWAIVMIKEAYVPIALDDFDFRSVPDVLIVFSCFTWASFRKTFAPKHFLLVAIGAWASYYYVAGVAKWNYGQAHSWLLENHLSNISGSGYSRGWASFVPEQLFARFLEAIRPLDRTLAAFTLVCELGALVGFFIHPRATRVWFLLCFVLNLGIFALTGICFWKWMVCNAAFWVWLGRGGEPILKQMCRHKLVILFGIATVFWSRNRVWYFPQTGVSWYDSRLLENYEIFAVGKSGERYLVHPSSLAPMEMHWVQARLCYATDEKSVTGIYGVTGSLATLKALETLKSPRDALRLYSGAKSCTNPDKQAMFDGFFTRYFQNINRHGRRHTWLRFVRRPTHLWVMPKGSIYREQEPVDRIELWRELVVQHGGGFHRLDRRKVHDVAIPP